MLNHKLDFSSCAWKPGFVKSSHILSCIYIQLYRVVCYHLFMRINIIMFLLFLLHLHWYDGIKRGIASLMVAVVVVVVLVTVVYVVVLTLVAIHVRSVDIN